MKTSEALGKKAGSKTRKTGAKPDAKGPVTVYLSLDPYKRFKEACDRAGSSASAELDSFIEAFNAEHAKKKSG